MAGRASAAACLLLAGATTARAQFALPTDFVDELVLGGFSEPVGMAFVPDGRLLVVERATGRIRLIVNGALAATDPVVAVPDVDASYGEEGLLGIAVDPGWPVRPYVYVQHTVLGAPFNRIVRFTASGDLDFSAGGSIAIDPASRYDVIPDLPHDSQVHNGGTLRFGPDGMLYSSVGDPTACNSQSRGELLGKILRLDISALPPGPGGPAPRALITPPDNPYAGEADPDAGLLWQWGLRNPFRFAIDPGTGDLVIGDVGGSEREELDYAAIPARNFEWPVYEGDVPGPYYCQFVDSSAFTGPIHAYDHSVGSAIIAGVLYRRDGSAAHPFPAEYDGDIFFSDFYAPWLRRLKRSGDTWSPAPAPGQPNADDWGTGAASISDWLIAPDGSLWYCRLVGDLGGPGQIRRIRYGGVVSVPDPPAPAAEFRSPFPSPSRGAVTFDFAPAGGEDAALTIYDASGRQVRVLAGRAVGSRGARRAVWDGRDEAGRPVAPGVYHARLARAGSVLARKVVILE